MGSKSLRIFNYLIATGLGMGYSPVAPGTVGSLVALFFFFCLIPVNMLSQLFLLSILFFIGSFCSSMVEKETGEDPSIVVIDEIVGMGISLILIPKDWRLFLIAFILFRIFDIWKPLFINNLQNIKGGLGIMLDDLLAGLYTLLAVHVIRLIFF